MTRMPRHATSSPKYEMQAGIRPNCRMSEDTVSSLLIGNRCPKSNLVSCNGREFSRTPFFAKHCINIIPSTTVCPARLRTGCPSFSSFARIYAYHRAKSLFADFIVAFSKNSIPGRRCFLNSYVLNNVLFLARVNLSWITPHIHMTRINTYTYKVISQ